jgi:indolepyruvate ferredoxin oxidoreductase alpha subunit
MGRLDLTVLVLDDLGPRAVEHPRRTAARKTRGVIAGARTTTTGLDAHQPNPGVDMEAMNLSGYGRISIEAVVRALGVEHVTLIKPYKVKKSIGAIREALAFEGVSVIISQEPCTLYAKSLKQLKPRAFTVTSKCKNHRDCINEIACPAFYLDGEAVKINETQCVGCAVCAQICPENAIVPLKKTG